MTWRMCTVKPETPLRLLRVAVVAWALAGCDSCAPKPAIDGGVPDAGPLVLTEKEPNDGPQQALLIERSAVVEANLAANPNKADEDWFQLKAELPQTVEVAVTCPPGADLALAVVDDMGTVILEVNSGGVDQAERFPNLDVSGRTLVRVAQVKKGAGGAYRLTALFRPRQGGFELEPNDRQIDATAVPLGQAISGYIAHPRDEDVYRFELPGPPEGASPPPGTDPAADGLDASAGAADAANLAGLRDAGAGAPAEPRMALRVDVSAVEGVAFEVQLLTEAQAVLFSAKSREGSGVALRSVGVRAVDRVVFVVVRSLATGSGKDTKRGANAITYYTLTVAPEDSDGNTEFEPNDESSKATELPSNGYREGFLTPQGDVDYYRLTAEGPSVAKVQLSGIEKVDLSLALVVTREGAAEEVLLKANEGGPREPEVLNDLFCNPSCLLRVEAAPRKVDGKWVKGDENGDMAYRIMAKTSPDDGSEEHEPNHTASTATAIRFGHPIRGTVYPKKDVDYFALDLRDRQVKTPLLATLLGVLKVDVGLYLHRVEGATLSLVQTSDAAKGDKPEVVRFSAEPGLYVLEVRDAKNREGNFQDSYQLTVEETQD